MVWDLATGIVVARKVEAVVTKHGGHCALGGSVMYKGASDKDLDIFVYPHDTGLPFKRGAIIDGLNKIGFTHKYENKSPYITKDVEIFEYQGRRVDVFFLKA
jgi:hypothetical protein